MSLCSAIKHRREAQERQEAHHIRDGCEHDATGEGWVAATTNHAYADAQRRGNPVSLHVTETTGAMSAALDGALRAVSKLSHAPGAIDNTWYGTSRSSPTTHYQHHVTAISAAIVMGDAHDAANSASHLGFLLTHGLRA